MDGFQLLFTLATTIGIGVLILSLLVGELFDFIGGHVAVDGPSWMASSVLSAAFAAFGISGLVAIGSGAGGGWSLAIGIGVGLLIGYVVVNFIHKPLARQQGNSMLSSTSYVGITAEVTLGIPPGGFGEVSFIDANGARVSRSACLSIPSGADVKRGTSVVIDTVEGHVVSVTTLP